MKQKYFPSQFSSHSRASRYTILAVYPEEAIKNPIAFISNGAFLKARLDFRMVIGLLVLFAFYNALNTHLNQTNGLLLKRWDRKLPGEHL